MQDPELVNQLKERLPEALFEKLNGSLSIDRDRLALAEYKVRVLEERLRLIRIEKYGPGSEKLSDAQLELLELEPGVSSAEVEAESERQQLKLPLKESVSWKPWATWWMRLKPSLATPIVRSMSSAMISRSRSAPTAAAMSIE